MRAADLYGGDFLDLSDGIREWGERRLKYGDALAAVAYAVGVPSFEALREIVPFDGVGRTPPEDGLTVADQLARLAEHARRTPRGVLEIGSGRGEVAVALADLGCFVTVVEPSSRARDWIARTVERFGDLVDYTKVVTHLELVNRAIDEAIAEIPWGEVDTVVMVESLEHVPEEAFEPAYERIREALRASRGRLIVTNWVDFHPIAVGQGAAPEIHCRRVDDALYDAWARDARSVAYRNGSHLVLDY